METATVTSDDMAAWWPLFEKVAHKYNGFRGAEFDDLVQEQAETAWLGLERGIYPTEDFLSLICLAWIRFVSHRGLVYEDHPYVPWTLHEQEIWEDYATKERV